MDFLQFLLHRHAGGRAGSVAAQIIGAGPALCRQRLCHPLRLMRADGGAIITPIPDQERGHPQHHQPGHLHRPGQKSGALLGAAGLGRQQLANQPRADDGEERDHGHFLVGGAAQ